MSETKTQEQLLASLLADVAKGSVAPEARIDPMQLLMRAAPQFVEGMSQRRQEMQEMKEQIRTVNARLKVLYRMLKRHDEKLTRLGDVHGQLDALTEAVTSIGAIFENSHLEVDDEPIGRRGVEAGHYERHAHERSIDRGTASGQLRFSERHMMHHRKNAER